MYVSSVYTSHALACAWNTLEHLGNLESPSHALESPSHALESPSHALAGRCHALAGRSADLRVFGVRWGLKCSFSLVIYPTPYPYT